MSKKSKKRPLNPRVEKTEKVPLPSPEPTEKNPDLTDFGGMDIRDLKKNLGCG